MRYAAQGDPSGEVLLFVHGWPDSWFSFSRVLPLLPAAYRAYALDQRGFGDSERPASGYAIDQFAADAVAFLDAVGAARATLIGHSMGTFVARRVAESRPERVTRLVLIGSAVTAVNEVTAGGAGDRPAPGDPPPPAFVREFQASTIHFPVPERFFEGIVAESLKAPARVWRSALEGLLAFDDAGRLEQIAAPTLLLWGDRDALFSGGEGQERLAAAIPGARLTVYAETGHSPNWERPELVAGDLRQFMEDAAAGPPVAGAAPVRQRHRRRRMDSVAGPSNAPPPGLADALEMPLVEALYGRRARRFSRGAAIPDGPLAFTSRHQPFPLTELERLLVLTAAAGNTGWHSMITRHARYAPHLSNYANAAGGRTFPSAAGFHTSEVFFTDDDGVYLFATRDAPALADREDDGTLDVDVLVAAHRGAHPQARRRPPAHPGRRALHGGAQHLVRQPPREHPAHPGGRPRAAPDRRSSASSCRTATASSTTCTASAIPGWSASGTWWTWTIRSR